MDAVQLLSIGCVALVCLSVMFAACFYVSDRQRVRLGAEYRSLRADNDRLRAANRCLANSLREQLHANDRRLAGRRHVIRAGDGFEWREVDRAKAEELLLAMAAEPGAFDGAVVVEIEG